MNLLIRADSSSSIGLGHIMRDLVLATQYPQDSITFACRDLPGNIIAQIPYPIKILVSNEPEELIDVIQTLNINQVIFDHYEIGYDFEKKVKNETGITIISLDDTYQKHCCDTLINPNIYADEQRYKGLVPSHTIIRCGKEFLLIRNEFHLAKKKHTKKNGTIFISMGGSDPQNLSVKVLAVLEKDTPIHLITTSSNPHLDELQHKIVDFPHGQLHINTSNIAKLMAESSLAIITPSSIAHEVIFMDLPFIAIQSADNQTEFTAYMKRQGMRVLDHFDPESFRKLLAMHYDRT